MAATLEEGVDNLQGLVDKGLRAQLKTGSLLTGKKLIELDMYPDAERVSITVEDGVPIVPTIPTVLDTLTSKVTNILDKLDRLPIEEISQDLRASMARVRQLLEQTDIETALDALSSALGEAETFAKRLNTDIGPKVSTTLGEAESFSRKLNTSLTPRLEETLHEFKDAARAIRIMSDYLERHPDALLRGKQQQ